MKFVIFGSGYHGRLALRKLISKSKKIRYFLLITIKQSMTKDV